MLGLPLKFWLEILEIVTVYPVALEGVFAFVMNYLQMLEWYIKKSKSDIKGFKTVRWVIRNFDFLYLFSLIQQNGSFVDWSPFVNEEEEFELESSDYSEWDLVTQSKEEGTCILLYIWITFQVFVIIQTAVW